MESDSPEIHIGVQIKRARKSRQLTQDALAEKLGITRSAISAIEKGKNGIRDSTLKALALALDIPLDKLQAGDFDTDLKAKAYEVYAVGPLKDQPYVDLPAPDFKTLAHFGQQPGLSLQSFAGSPTLRLHLAPGEMPERYIGAMVVTIFGNSMEPELHDGQRMVVWYIPESKWEQLHNTVCVVSYEDTVTIKGIAENDLFVHDRLTLRAANPPSSYFVVGRSKINSVWEVREYYDRPKYNPGFIRRR